MNADTKVSEVPKIVSANLNKEKAVAEGNAFFRSYQARYIKTGKGNPVFHVMVGVCALGLLIKQAPSDH